MSHIQVDRLAQVYTRCYCEENVWHLCRALQEKACSINQSNGQLVEIYAVFVSNPNQQVAFWHQRSPNQPTDHQLNNQEEEDINDFVVWDYHVFLVMTVKQCDEFNNQTSYIYDLDTNLPFPCSFEQYVEQALKTPQSVIQSINQSNTPNNQSINLSPNQMKRFCTRYFRVISADHFLSEFASDRSHMIKQSKKSAKCSSDVVPVEWMSPPPIYPCIQPTTLSNDQTSIQTSNQLMNNLDYYRFIPSEIDQPISLSTDQSIDQSTDQQTMFGSITPIHSMIYNQKSFVQKFGSNTR